MTGASVATDATPTTSTTSTTPLAIDEGTPTTTTPKTDVTNITPENLVTISTKKNAELNILLKEDKTNLNNLQTRYDNISMEIYNVERETGVPSTELRAIRDKLGQQITQIENRIGKTELDINLNKQQLDNYNTATSEATTTATEPVTTTTTEPVTTTATEPVATTTTEPVTTTATEPITTTTTEPVVSTSTTTEATSKPITVDTKTDTKITVPEGVELNNKKPKKVKDAVGDEAAVYGYNIDGKNKFIQKRKGEHGVLQYYEVNSNGKVVGDPLGKDFNKALKSLNNKYHIKKKQPKKKTIDEKGVIEKKPVTKEGAQIVALRKNIDVISKNLATYEKMYKDGKLTKDQYRAKVGDLNLKEVQTRNQIKSLENTIRDNGDRYIAQAKTKIFIQKKIEKMKIELRIINIKIQMIRFMTNKN